MPSFTDHFRVGQVLEYRTSELSVYLVKVVAVNKSTLLFDYVSKKGYVSFPRFKIGQFSSVIDGIPYNYDNGYSDVTDVSNIITYFKSATYIDVAKELRSIIDE